MDDAPMILQGVRNNWADNDEPLVHGLVAPFSKPLRACWRWWPHPGHMHIGAVGDDLARCTGIAKPSDWGVSAR